jgi:hypothetical protein
MHILAMGGGSPSVVIIPALGANVLEWVRVLRAGAWVRGGWVEMKDDRRYLSASGRKWLAERGIPTLG